VSGVTRNKLVEGIVAEKVAPSVEESVSITRPAQLSLGHRESVFLQGFGQSDLPTHLGSHQATTP